MRLAIDPRDGKIRLTIPPRASLAKAMQWVREQQGWIAAQRETLPECRPFVPGARIPFGDGDLTIVWPVTGVRGVRQAGGQLLCGGTAEGLARRVERWLRAEALRTLSEETAQYAALAGVRVTKVAIGDARSRWGSCASTGVIRYSWRLILAPSAVRRATVAHEVAHRVHMNHGPDFHALVEQLYGADPTPHRHWLRRYGAGLHWIGRAQT
ncbi:YgjP-like metallopeptidase domain-containing protein [Sphingomonas sp. WG]|uniref:M48 family metallopeptidase n=2 Tax=Sphingomonas TaxID=13687 RepID=UPI0003029156